jgi:sugar phosphate isomerase/epimerase
LDRRQFIKTSLAGFAAMSVSNSAWALAPNKRAYSELGVQLYTLRSLFEHDYQGTLQKIADIGYKDLEFAGYYKHDPKAVKAFMNDLGLSSHSSHVQLADVENNFEQAMEIASIMGQSNLIIPWYAPERRTLDGYKWLADIINTRGEQAKAAGFTLAYHNHDFEFDTVDGVVPYDLLLERTDPNVSAMELDLFWCHKAGVDPIEYFNRAPGRFIACHVKDRTPGGDMVSVGDGIIDYDSIFKHAEKAGLEYFYVEHDNPENPVDSITRSFKHMTS